MRKQTKLIVALSATALLALGLSAVSFAAGWDNSTGEWQYIDSNGDAVTDKWVKNGDYWFYLGDDGNMVRNQIVEDNTNSSKTKYYFVDENGAMISNTWKAVEIDDDADLDAEYYWYYFGSDGKAYTTDSADDLNTAKIKTINGKKYAFDEEGHMLYGWIKKDDKSQQDNDDSAWKDSQYYFNGWNDGHMSTGWQQIAVVDDDEDDQDQTYWFYFKDSGEKRTDTSEKINGVYYHFDNDDGHMLDEWVSTASDGAISATTTTSAISYLNGDGGERRKSWVWAVPSEDFANEFGSSDYDDDEYSWWWFDNSGNMATSVVKYINGKNYAFDDMGRMQTEFVLTDKGTKTVVASGDDVIKTDDMGRDEVIAKGDMTASDDLYYFSDDEEKDGSRKNGYQSVELSDGTYKFYFSTTNSKAATGYVSKINKYTFNGLVLMPSANDDSNYVGVSVEGTHAINDTTGYKTWTPTGVTNGNETEGCVLVNASGTVVTGGSTGKSVKDNNGRYYLVDKNGMVVDTNDNDKYVTTTAAKAQFTIGGKYWMIDTDD